MSANRLVDAASASATILQSSNTSPEKRNDVRKVLEATVRRLVPFEKSQGTCLLDLGRVMLEAIECLYLGKTDGDSHENGRAGQEREETEEVEEEKPEVPENELVKETRQVFIRGEFFWWERKIQGGYTNFVFIHFSLCSCWTI